MQSQSTRSTYHMNQRKDITEDLIRKLYLDENKTLRQIAKELNCDVNTINKRVIKYGIKKDRLTYYRENYRWTEERRRKYEENPPIKTQESIDKMIQTKVERYGENWGKIFVYKAFESYKEKTGYDNPFQNIEAVKGGMLKKYGVTSPNYVSESKEKMRRSWDLVDREELSRKKKKTCVERYGVESPAQNEEIQKKMRKTCLERYGVENIFLLDDLKYNKKKKNSIPNERFAKLLDSSKTAYEREYTIGMKSYDFKVNKYLIEINPFATHNSTWGAYCKNGVDSMYHFNKSKLAEENNLICIHVFDWFNIDSLLDVLTDKCELKYKQLEYPRCIIFNYKTQEHFIKQKDYVIGKYEVEIYDDGKIYENLE